MTSEELTPETVAEWRTVPAGDVGRFRGGSGFPLRFQGQASGEVPFFKVSDMNLAGNEKRMTRANHYISEVVRKQLGATLFPAGSIVFAKVGAAVFLERKRILAQPSCIDNNMAALVLDPSRADIEFVHQLLLTIRLGDLVSATALPALNGSDLASMPLSLPSTACQREVAAVLERADALLGKLDQLIAKKRDLKQAAMQLLLPGHRRLPGHAEPWLRVQLGDLFDFRNGVNAEKRAYGRGIQFINVLEVITRPHLTAEHVPGRVLLARGVQENFSVRRGDVLFNRTSETQGEVALASAYIDDAPMVFGGFVIRGRPKAQRLDALYAGYGLRAPEVRQQLVARGQGAIRSNVGQAELSAVEVRLPCVREQQAIAAVLSDMDTELTALEARREKTRQLKQGMMQALLTGRIRLV